MSNRTKIRVGIACHSRLLSDSLLTCLKHDRDFAVQDFVSSSVTVANSSCLDVIIAQYDPQMHLLRQLANVQPSAKIVLIDADAHELDAVGCLQLGIAGFMTKELSSHELPNAIRLVARGKRIVPESVTERLYAQLRDLGQRRNHNLCMGVSDLTLRERQVGELLMEGLSNKEVAERLRLSTYTVKSHVHNILGKLQIHSRIELVNFFWSRGGACTIPSVVSSVSSTNNAA